jgi:TolB-like protein/Tfp pilus assembly protein PilF
MWSQEIVSAIRNCKVLVLAISGNSADSKNVVKELALASEGQKNILPVYLESAEIPESMAYQLAGIQRVEFFGGDEEVGQQSVIRALAKLGVTVSEEASAAAAGSPKRTSHGASHATTSKVAKNEKAAWSKIAAAVGGVAVLAAGIFFLGSRGNDTTEQIQTLAIPQTLNTNRVVVLPFKTIGSSGETADLGYGLVSTLTSKLQPLQNLTVIANESALQFEGSKLAPKKIGQALQVGTIVTGEIQTSGNKVQVNIRVIDANTEALGWGSTFMKSRDEFLDLQNEIATSLASEIKGGLETEETKQLARKATQNPEAQAAYQSGRREWNKRSKEGFENAIEHFKEAINLDQNYADPYAGLADTYLLMVNYNHAAREDCIPLAKKYSQTALEKNPNLAAAYVSIAWLQHMFEYNWTAAEENYKKALKLNPNYAMGNFWYGIMLNTSDRLDESLKYYEKAAQLDPNSMIIKAVICGFYYKINNKELALKYANEALEMSQNNQFALRVKYMDLQVDGIDGAIAKYKNLQETQSNDFRSELFKLYLLKGDKESALEEFTEIVAEATVSQNINTQMFILYNSLGKYEHALNWLEKAIKNKEPFMNIINNDEFNLIRKKERFIQLMKSINHPAFID